MLRILLRSFGLLVAFASVHAEAESAASDPIAQASEAAGAARILGPTTVDLGEQATLEVPAGFAFVPKAEAAALLEAMGNQTGAGFYGIVVGEYLQGFVSVQFDDAGYVEDDDAREWDADELLQNLKDGTAAGNEERKARGIAEFDVAGWVEPPRYDGTTYRLVWSAELRNKDGAAANEGAGVNYNTYQLGREGYVSMNLVTDLASIEAQKPLAHQLLAGLDFKDSKRYTDFDPATDKVAAYGLAALVGGLAAKKLGLLAMAGLFLVKFGKIAAVVALGGLAAAAKFWRGRGKA